MPEISDELLIQMKSWPNGKKSTLIISLDTLMTILFNESAIICDEDVAGLLGAIHAYAARTDKSDQKALDLWDDEIKELEDDEDEESEDE